MNSQNTSNFTLTSLLENAPQLVPYNKYLTQILASIDGFQQFFTDGSKIGSRIGYSFTINGVIRKFRLRNSFFIFSVELAAILLLLQYTCFHDFDDENFVILSNFLSALTAIQNSSSSNLIL